MTDYFLDPVFFLLFGAVTLSAFVGFAFFLAGGAFFLAGAARFFGGTFFVPAAAFAFFGALPPLAFTTRFFA
jgi:hypothetical protein